MADKSVTSGKQDAVATSSGQTNVSGHARVHQGDNTYHIHQQPANWDRILQFVQAVSALDRCGLELLRQGVNNGTAHETEAGILKLWYITEDLLEEFGTDLRNEKKLRNAFEAKQQVEQTLTKVQKEAATAAQMARELEEKVDAAQKVIATRTDECKRLSVTLQETQSSLDQARTQVKANKERCAKLEDQLARSNSYHQRMLAESGNQILDLQQQKKSLTDALDASHKSLADERASKSEGQRHHTEAVKRLDMSEKRCQRLEDEKQQLSKALKGQSDQLTEMEVQLKNLKDAYGKTAERLKDSQQRSEAYEQQMNFMLEQLDGLKTQLGQQRAQVRDAEQKYLTQAAELESQVKAHDLVKVQLGKSQGDVKSLTQSLEKLLGEATVLSNANNHKSNTIRDLISANDKQRQETTELQGLVQTLLRKSNESLAFAGDQISALTLDIGKLKQSSALGLKQMQSEREEYASKLKEVQKQYAMQLDNLRDMQTLLSDRESALDAASQHEEAFRRSIDQSKLLKDSLSKRVSALEGMIAGNLEETKHLQDLLADPRSSARETERQSSAVRHNVKKLEELNVSLESKFGDLDGSLRNAAALIETSLQSSAQTVAAVSNLQSEKQVAQKVQADIVGITVLSNTGGQSSTKPKIQPTARQVDGRASPANGPGAQATLQRRSVTPKPKVQPTASKPKPKAPFDAFLQRLRY